jgi:hypothetical protein
MADGGVVSDSDIGVGAGVVTGIGFSAVAGLVFGGSEDGSTGATDGADVGEVDVCGPQPDSSTSIKTNMNKKFHLIHTS